MVAQPRKRTQFRYHTADGKPCSSRTPGVIRTTVKSQIYYGYHRGKYVPLFAKLAESKELFYKIQAAGDRWREVLNPAPANSPGAGTIAEWLEDYRTHLVAVGDTRQHVHDALTRLRRICPPETRAGGLTADLAARGLRELRRGSSPPAIPNKPEFTMQEVRELLGVTRISVNHAIRTHGLKARGVGKARRCPRATVQALAERRSRGASPQTVNHHIATLRAFGRWLVENGKVERDPFATLRPVEVRSERRHDRRELTADEIRRLLAVAGESTRKVAGTTGADRRAIYLLAFSTGWRAAAVASVTPADFHLDADPPQVVMPARVNKSRKVKRQPLPASAVAFFREYLKGRPAAKRVWPSDWGRRGAEMLRADLEDAGIPYSVPGPDGPLFADFHALRHSYITALGRAGVDLRTAQELAGHSTPVLTARYMHRDLGDQARGAAKLPSVI